MNSAPEADDVEGAIDHRLYAFYRLVQINPKLFKIQPSPAMPSQRKSKKEAWISLDSLGGNEPFQRVALTPQGEKSCLAPFPCNWPRQAYAFVPEHAPKITLASDFRKQMHRRNSVTTEERRLFAIPSDQAASVETHHAPALERNEALPGNRPEAGRLLDRSVCFARRVDGSRY